MVVSSKAYSKRFCRERVAHHLDANVDCALIRSRRFYKWPNISHTSLTRGPPPFTTFVNPSFSNHALLFCPLPPPPQCVSIALSFSNVCKISTFDPRKAFFVLSNGTLIACGRFSVPQSAIGNSPFGLPKSASDGSIFCLGFARGRRAFPRSRPRLWFPRFVARR